MRGSFAVSVTHAGKPLQGVAVQVTLTGSPNAGVFSGTTGADGIVKVADLPAGDYWISADLLGINAAYHCFYVGRRPTKKAKSKAEYEWGDSAISTRQVAGNLVGVQPGQGGTPLWNLVHPVEHSIDHALLELRHPTNGTAYKQVTDEQGRFAFEGVPNDTYVLHVSSGEVRDYETADVLIQISPATRRSTLLLKRSYDGCGGSRLHVE